MDGEPARVLLGRSADLTGRRFGRLMVEGPAERRGGYLYWASRCDCGGVSIARTGDLTHGRTVSCGCRSEEGLTARHHKMGGRDTREYTCWRNMRARCSKPTRPDWPYYGGRGIKVCPEWDASFERFHTDMGNAPAGYTLDRIDVNGNYEPGNCRWASRTVQMRNTRANRLLTYAGHTATMIEWGERLGIGYSTLHHRLYRMPFETIVLSTGAVDVGI